MQCSMQFFLPNAFESAAIGSWVYAMFFAVYTLEIRSFISIFRDNSEFGRLYFLLHLQYPEFQFEAGKSFWKD